MKKVSVLIILILVWGSAFALDDSLLEDINQLFSENKASEVIELVSQQDGYETDPEALFYIGYAFFILEQDDQAQGHFISALAIDPDNLAANEYLGLSYFYTGNLESAESQYLRCIEINPDYHKAYYLLSLVKGRENDLDSAISYAKSAFELDPGNGNYKYRLGMYYFDSGDYDNAWPLLKALADADPSDYFSISMCMQMAFKKGVEDVYTDLKGKLKEARMLSRDQRLRQLKHFQIETFTFQEYYIEAAEAFDFDEELYYHWIFRIFNAEGTLEKVINLESSSVIRELGTDYIIGIDHFRDNSRYHETTNIGFKGMPSYETVKEYVILELTEGLNVGASSEYPNKQADKTE